MTPKLPDPRNENILIYIGGQLLLREEAKISVFDSLVQGGDGVWEGLRVYDGRQGRWLLSTFRLTTKLSKPFFNP